MAEVEKSLVVDKDVHTVYNQWTQFESFPQFMEGVEKVTQLDDSHLHWVVKIGGKQEEYDAVITQQEPDQRIAWRSTEGAPNAGDVRFQPAGDDKTEVFLHLVYEPEGAIEKAGDALGFVSRRVEGDLERFKKFIEERGGETGAWRGEVDQTAPIGSGGNPNA
jgi:uncharacterized membrane protein